MNLFDQATAIGMPFHGLAVDGVLTTPSGDKTINGAGPAAYPGTGACVLVRNPQAPGANRNPAQLAIDAANGHDWRDYALLCGIDRHVNGGPAIGQNAWLYIDGNGVPWICTVEQTAIASQLDIEVWRRALFGRFGRQYAINDELLASFSWTPQMPSWYTGGVTATDVVADAFANNIVALVPSPDGASLIINVHGSSQDVASVFPETNFGAGNLLSILTVSVSGSGDPNNGGLGISATIVESASFETDLVTLRTEIVDTDGSNDPSPQWQVNCTAPTYPPSEPTPAQADANATTLLQHSTSYGGLIQGGLTDYLSRIESESTAIIYRTHRGDITRHDRSVSYDRNVHTNPAGTRFADATWEAYWDDPPGQSPTPRWRFLSCGPVSGQITHDLQRQGYTETLIEVSAFGTTEGVHVVIDDREDTQREFWDGCTTACIGHDFTSTQNLGDAAFSYTCNGESYPQGTGTLAPEAGMAWKAPNLFVVFSDFTLPDGANRRYTQRWVGDGEAAAAELWSDVSTWLLSHYQNHFPSPLHLRSSFQPVTMEFAHALADNQGLQYC